MVSKKHHHAPRESRETDGLLKPQDVKVLGSLNRIWKTMVAIGGILGSLYAFENWNSARIASKMLEERKAIYRQEFENRMKAMKDQTDKLDDKLDQEIKERLQDKVELEQHLNRNR